MKFLAFLLLLIMSAGPFVLLFLILKSRSKHWSRFFLIIGVVLILFQVSTGVYILLEPRLMSQRLMKYWETERHLFKKGEADYRILPLSLMVQGMVYHQQNPDLIQSVIEQAMSPDWNPYRAGFGLKYLDQRGLWLSHLALMQSSFESMTGDTKYSLSQIMIYTHFFRLLGSSRNAHLRSYPYKSWTWPADNAVIYLALTRMGAIRGYTNHLLPVQIWFDILEKQYLAEEWGLPVSEITGGTRYSQYPRGCANAWLITYMSSLNPELAKKYWRQYKRHYKRKALLLGAFREYPRGISLPPDSDSGPIILGYGSAASALSLITARHMGDYWTWWQLRHSQALISIFVPLARAVGAKHIYDVYHSPLAYAIRLNY